MLWFSEVIMVSSGILIDFLHTKNEEQIFLYFCTNCKLIAVFALSWYVCHIHIYVSPPNSYMGEVKWTILRFLSFCKGGLSCLMPLWKYPVQIRHEVQRKWNFDTSIYKFRITQKVIEWLFCILNLAFDNRFVRVSLSYSTKTTTSSS